MTDDLYNDVVVALTYVNLEKFFELTKHKKIEDLLKSIVGCHSNCFVNDKIKHIPECTLYYVSSQIILIRFNAVFTINDLTVLGVANCHLLQYIEMAWCATCTRMYIFGLHFKV